MAENEQFDDAIFNAFLKTPLPLAKGTAPAESKSIRIAADVNNPSGILVGKDKNGKPVYKTYKTPEEGVADTQLLIDNYLNNRGAMKSTKATPENIVGMWVNGDPTTGTKVQNGAYLNTLNKELKKAGIVLNDDGSIPNSPEANAAITRTLIQHEAGTNADKFFPHVNATNEDVDKIFNSFVKEQPKATISIGEPTSLETPRETVKPNYLENFTEAAGHHILAPLHGAANLVEQGLATGLEKVLPESTIAKLMRSTANADVQAVKNWENQYQQQVPTNAASVAGAITGEVLPLMATGIGKAITTGGEIGANLASRLGLGQTGQTIGNVGGKAVASGATSGLLGLTQPTLGEKPYWQQVQENVQNNAMLGAALPVATKAIGSTAKAVGNLGASLLGLSTGVGATPIQEAFKAGKNGFNEFWKNLTGEADKNAVLDVAKSNLRAIQQDLSKAYRSGMINIKNDKNILSFNDIDQSLKKVEDIALYKGEVTSKSANDAFNKVKEAITDWKKLDPTEYHTPEGLDALKQKLGGVLEEIPYEQKKARTIVENAYNAVKSSIQKQAPTYANVMKGYAEGQETISEIKKALSLGEKASVDTGLRKLQSLMRNNANANYGYRLDLAKQLEEQGGNQIMPALAGQSLSSITPRSLAAQGGGILNLGNIARGMMMNDPSAYGSAAMLPLQSPALVGASSYGLGKLYGLGNKISPEQANILKLLSISNYNKEQATKGKE